MRDQQSRSVRFSRKSVLFFFNSYRIRGGHPSVTARSIRAPSRMSSDASAISTTFTPPATCTQDHLTLMEYYQYEIWLNYPVPVPGTTSTQCYPSQYVSSYFSAQYITTPLPAPTPLVCPVGYGTILSTTIDSSSEYIACCPS